MTDLHIPQLEFPIATTRQSSFGFRRILLAVAVLLAVGIGARLLIRHQETSSLQDYTAKSLVRTVLISQAKPGELQRTLSLPTTLKGNTEAIIYARTTGYLAAWHKGIGDHVKKGEQLATIDAPEQDYAMAQARAERDQLAARLELSEQTLSRWISLEQHQAVSQQDIAERRSLVRQGQADLAAATANVNRLEQQSRFRHIAAPFDGVLTKRNIEVGDLISSGDKALFTLVQLDPLRLTIWVPQLYADNLKPGSDVTVRLSERQGFAPKAKVERIAGGIDIDSRARQVDLLLPNPGGQLLPGAYAEASIQLSRGIKALVVPAAVLLVNDQTQRIAVVDADNRIAFREVKLGRDLGREVEVLEGISDQDTLVVSPADQLVEGEQVLTLAWKPQPSSPAAPAPKKEVVERK